jgi:hypothetical protein
VQPSASNHWRKLTNSRVVVPKGPHLLLQYTPVLSSAKWVQPLASNHWRKLTNSRVVVPKVRICFCALPSFRTINKQATTVA